MILYRRNCIGVKSYKRCKKKKKRSTKPIDKKRNIKRIVLFIYKSSFVLITSCSSELQYYHNWCDILPRNRRFFDRNRIDHRRSGLDCLSTACPLHPNLGIKMRNKLKIKRCVKIQCRIKRRKKEGKKN